MKPIPIETPILVGPGESRIVYEPLGVIAVMGSWNFPMFTTLAPLVNVIAAGNAAIIKPSELAPHSSRAMGKLLSSCLDPELYSCIEGKVQVAVALTSAKVDGICFTGSTEKGKLVAQAAAKNLVPCLLELGGKSPLIVDKGCDLDNAAKKAAFGRFMNAGQACVAPDYVIVHRSLKDPFIAKVKHYIQAFWDDGRNKAAFG